MTLAYSFLARNGEGQGEGDDLHVTIYREPTAEGFFTTTLGRNNPEGTTGVLYRNKSNQIKGHGGWQTKPVSYQKITGFNLGGY